MHSMLRGGTANLLITSANLTFQDFFTRLNKVNQIKKAEYSLQKLFVEQRSTKSQMQKSSGEDCINDKSYEKPSCYGYFVANLMASCLKGDIDSKASLETLAPQLVVLLKKHNQWNKPDHHLDMIKESLELL